MKFKKLYTLLKKQKHSIRGFPNNELRELGRTKVTAMVTAQIIENFYTSVETLFLRISQFFENSLNKDKWHKDLLGKMALHIEGVRDRVITEATYKDLTELLQFRHFKRYYFELEYDWGKLDFLTGKLEAQFKKLRWN